MTSPTSEHDPFQQITDEFQARCQAGERPELADYLARYPEFADRIREQFSKLAGEQKAQAADRTEPLGARPGRSESSDPRESETGGERFGRFELMKQIGEGEFGTVWRARDTELRREVALKVPRQGLLDDRHVRERFEREAQAAAQLRHPGIVSVHEVVRLNDGSPALVADFIEGVTLREMLQAGPLSPHEGAALMMAVAEALDYAHGRQIVHRDIKPANILVEAQGGEAGGPTKLRPLIADFGLALHDKDLATLTQDGQILGTPVYMSPEQARGEGHRVDHRTDVYSLGAVLYEVLCGEPLFPGNAAEVLAQVRFQEPVRPRRINAGTPRALEAICLKCLEKDPARRYATAGEVAAELGRFLRGEPVRARPPRILGRAARWIKQRPTAAALLAAVALLAAAGAVGWHYYQLAAAARHEEELALAHSFARPLGQGDASAPLSETELDALRKLAECPNDRVRGLFLDAPLAEPEVAERMGRRAQYAVHAAVGLDEARRQEALKLIRAKLEAPSQDPRIRSAAIEIGLALRDGPSIHIAVDAALPSLTVGADASVLQQTGARLEALAEAMNPQDAEASAEKALAVLAKTHNPQTITVLGNALVTLAKRVQSERAPALAYAGASARAVNYFPDEIKGRAESLRSVAAALNPNDAAAAAQRTLDWLASFPEEDRNSIQGNPYPMLFVADLPLLCERMTDADAVAAAQRADALAKKAGNYWVREILTGAVEALAGRPKAGERARSPLLCYLARITPQHYGMRADFAQVRRKDNGDPRRLSDEELASLAAEMKTDEVTAAIEEIIDVMENGNEENQRDSFRQDKLAQAILVLAKQLSSRPVAAPRPIIERIVQAIAKTDNLPSLKTLSKSAETLAERLSPSDAAAVAPQVLDAVEKVGNVPARWGLVATAGFIATTLKPEEAAVIAANAVRRAVLASDKSKKPEGPNGRRRALDEGLQAVAASEKEREAGGRSLEDVVKRLPAKITPENAVAAAQCALESFSYPDSWSPKLAMVAALGEIAERLKSTSPSLAAAVAQLGIDSMLGTERFSSYRDESGKRLRNAVVPNARYLSPSEAKDCVRRILDSITNPRSGYYGEMPLGETIAALAAQMETADAEKLVRQGLNTIGTTHWNPYTRALGKGTAALCGRIRSDEAAAMEVQAIAAIGSAPGIAQAHNRSASEKIEALGDIAVELAALLKPDAARIAAKAALTAASRKHERYFDESNADMALGRVLAALGKRVKPDALPEGDLLTAVGLLLTSRWSDERSHETLRKLTAALAEPAKLNDHDIVAEVVRGIIPLVANREGPAFGKVFELLAPRLKSEEAAAAIQQAHDVMRASYSSTVDPMVEAVTHLARRVNPNDATKLARQHLNAIIGGGNDRHHGMYNSKVLAALAERMKPAEIGDAVAQLLEPFIQPTDSWDLDNRLEVVFALAKRLKSEEVASTARRIVAAMPQSVNERVLLSQARMVQGLADRMEATTGTAIARSAANQAILTMFLHPEFAHAVLRHAVPTLTQGMRLDAAEAIDAAAVDGLIAISPVLGNARLAQNRHPQDWQRRAHEPLAEAAKTLIAQMKASDAAATLKRELELISQTTDAGTIQLLEALLPALAERIKTKDAAELVQRALGAMTRAKDNAALGALGRAAVVLATRMENDVQAPVVVAAALRALAVMGRENEGVAPWRFGEKEAIARAAPLASKDCRSKAEKVLDALNGLRSSEDCRHLGTAVKELTSFMDPDTAAAFAGVTARAFLNVLGDDPAHAWTFLNTNGQWNGYYQDPENQAAAFMGTASRFATGLAAVAERMNADEAAAVTRQAALRLLAATLKSEDKSDSSDLAHAIRLLLAHMEPAAAAHVADATAERLLKSLTTDAGRYNHPYGVAEAMAGLVGAMTPARAAAAAETTVQYLRLFPPEATYPQYRNAADRDAGRDYQKEYRQALTRLAARIDPDYAAAAVQQAFYGSAAGDLARAQEEVMRRAYDRMPYGDAAKGRSPHSELVGALLTRCTVQGLIDLLKQPDCLGDRRRLILREWAKRYKQDTEDIWEFAAWVRENESDIDLKSPPRHFPKENDHEFVAARGHRAPVKSTQLSQPARDLPKR
jgi:tRNA A-37 threonylcarbamoyl transferase component Bud32